MNGAEGLLNGLHGDALRMLSDATGLHHNGLEMAARWARNKGKISQRMYEKLQNVATAYNVVRHITGMSCKDMLAEMARETGEATADTESDESKDSVGANSVGRMEPKCKKVRIQQPEDDNGGEREESPAVGDRDIGKEMLAHMDFLLLRKRVDVLERAEARRDGPVGNVLQATPIIFKMVERLQEEIGKIQQGQKDQEDTVSGMVERLQEEIEKIQREQKNQKDTATFITYFCREVVQHLQDSAAGLPAHIVAPSVV